MLKKCELSEVDLEKLINYSKRINFISTPYDQESALLLIKQLENFKSCIHRYWQISFKIFIKKR